MEDNKMKIDDNNTYWNNKENRHTKMIYNPGIKPEDRISVIKDDNVNVNRYSSLLATENTIPKTKGNRLSKNEYYISIAKTVAMRSTCLRRKYGAIIVKDDRIVSTGYAGAPHGRRNCCDLGVCVRMKYNVTPGTRYELCRSVHAEMNAIISASSEETNGAIMYLAGIENDGSLTNSDCCSLCKRIVINAGIKYVIASQTNGELKLFDVQQWIDNDDSLNSYNY